MSHAHLAHKRRNMTTYQKKKTVGDAVISMIKLPSASTRGDNYEIAVIWPEREPKKVESEQPLRTRDEATSHHVRVMRMVRENDPAVLVHIEEEATVTEMSLEDNLPEYTPEPYDDPDELTPAQEALLEANPPIEEDEEEETKKKPKSRRSRRSS